MSTGDYNSSYITILDHRVISKQPPALLLRKLAFTHAPELITLTAVNYTYAHVIVLRSGRSTRSGFSHYFVTGNRALLQMGLARSDIPGMPRVSSESSVIPTERLISVASWLPHE